MHDISPLPACRQSGARRAAAPIASTSQGRYKTTWANVTESRTRQRFRRQLAQPEWLDSSAAGYWITFPYQRVESPGAVVMPFWVVGNRRKFKSNAAEPGKELFPLA